MASWRLPEAQFQNIFPTIYSFYNGGFISVYMSLAKPDFRTRNNYAQRACNNPKFTNWSVPFHSRMCHCSSGRGWPLDPIMTLPQKLGHIIPEFQLMVGVPLFHHPPPDSLSELPLPSPPAALPLTCL